MVQSQPRLYPNGKNVANLNRLEAAGAVRGADAEACVINVIAAVAPLRATFCGVEAWHREQSVL